MTRPRVVVPKTLQEAVQELRGAGAVPLAGATDLIPAMRRGEAKPRALVNLKQIRRLTGIRRARGGLRIGSTTTLAQLLESSVIADDFPLLVEVARDFGSPLIRNLATVGGNLCNAAPSADLAIPFLVLDARVEIHGPEGRRDMDLADFFRGVNRTALARDEILTGVLIRRPRSRTGAAYAKLGVRRAMDLAIVAVAAAIVLSPGSRRCRQARVALGAVGPTPMRARAAESVLEGTTVTPSLVEQAAQAAAAEARPVSDLRASTRYRRDMTRVLTRRVLGQAVRRAAQKEGSQ